MCDSLYCNDLEPNIEYLLGMPVPFFALTLGNLEYYSAIKKNKIIPSVATRMDIKIIILSEVSRTKTNIRYHLYTESKIRIQTDVFMKQKQTHRHGKQTYS